MKNDGIKAAIIIAAAILVAACIIYAGLSRVGTSILNAGQDIGLKIANKNHLRVDVNSADTANPNNN